MAERYFLLEIEGWNPASQTVETLYFTDGPGLQTEAGDAPADTWYVPALRVPAEAVYTRSLFRDGRTGGASEIAISDGIAILNAAGAWDHLADWGWDGQRCRLYVLTAGQARSAAILVLSAVTEQLLPVYRVAAGAGEYLLTLRIQDPLARFDVPIQATKYLGTNVGPDGLEGTADDLKGLPKPLAYGLAFEVPARPVNTSLLVYQLADHAIAEVVALRDNQVLLTLDDDYPTVAALTAATPASGEYATCLAAGLVMLGATPAGRITADILAAVDPTPTGEAVAFDGTGDFYDRTGSYPGTPVFAWPSGLAGLRFTLSFWARLDASTGSMIVLDLPYGDPAEGDFGIRASWSAVGGGEFQVLARRNSGAGTGLSAAFGATDQWVHVLASFDLWDGREQVAIDGTVVASGSFTGSLPFGPAALYECVVGAACAANRGSEPAYWNGALAEVFLIGGHAPDLAVAENVEKFRTLAGKPADLGQDGSAVFGVPPQLYLRGRPEVFGSNLGAGGDLALNGDPAVADSDPYGAAPAPPSSVRAADIIYRIARQRAGLTDGEIDADAFAAAQAADADVGIWIGEERTVRDVLDEVANSAALAYWWRSDGRLALGRFALPAGAPAMTLTFDDLVALERQPVSDTGFGLPAYSIVVEYGLINQVPDPDAIAGSVEDAARLAYLERAYRQTSAADNTVRAKHRLAPEFIFRTLITNEADAVAFAADRLALYSRGRSRWKAQVPITAETAALDLFDVVELQVPRFGLDAGKLFRVLGIGSDFRANRIDLDLWGGEPSPIRVPWLGRRVTIHPPTVIGSATTITVPFLGNRVTVHSPRIGLYLRPPFLGSRATIHAPTVSTSTRVQVPFLGGRATVHSPTVLPGGVTVQVPALGNRATIHAPTVLPGGVAVQVPFLGLRATLHGPTVSAAYRVQVPALGNRVTVHAPTLVYDQAVAVPFLGSRVAVHSPVVQSGNTFIVVPFLGDRAAIHAPTVAAAYRVTVPALGNRVTIHAPTITARATVAVPALGLRATIHDPAVAAAYRVTVPALGTRITVHGPTVVPDQLVTVPALGNRATLHAPTLSAAYRIAAGDLGNRITIHEPQIITGDLRLTEAGDIRITEAGDARELE